MSGHKLSLACFVLGNAIYSKTIMEKKELLGHQNVAGNILWSPNTFIDNSQCSALLLQSSSNCLCSEHVLYYAVHLWSCGAHYLFDVACVLVKKNWRRLVEWVRFYSFATTCHYLHFKETAMWLTKWGRAR